MRYYLLLVHIYPISNFNNINLKFKFVKFINMYILNTEYKYDTLLISDKPIAISECLQVSLITDNLYILVCY